MRKMNVRNHGLGSRDMCRALVTAYTLKGNGDNSNHGVKTALSTFADHLKNEQGIKDLRNVNKDNVLCYANHLKEKFERGDISASTAQNYLSPVNVALENAKLDRSCRVDGVREAGLPERTGIATSDKSTSLEKHNAFTENLDNRLSIQIELQRELGLRFKESCLIDAKAVLQHAEKTGIIKIESGTKGGREREFTVTSSSQIQVLEKAAALQGRDRSLVPSELKWSEYQTQSYSRAQENNFKFHGERHHFANERYEQISGVRSPVRAGVEHNQHHAYIAKTLSISHQEAREIDQAARLEVSRELGHERIAITNSYLG